MNKQIKNFNEAKEAMLKRKKINVPKLNIVFKQINAIIFRQSNDGEPLVQLELQDMIANSVLITDVKDVEVVDD